jgi:hypothetical protein
LNEDRVQKKLKSILSKNESNCSKCKVEYKWHCHTYMGVDMQKRSQVVANCCLDKMKTIYSVGIFTMEKGLSESQAIELRNEMLRTHPYRKNIK